jgi:hypothetical protein
MFPIARTNFAARSSCAAIGRTLSVILLSVALAAHVFAQESPTSHTGPITLRVTRGSGEEQSADRSGPAKLAGGETSADTSLDAAPTRNSICSRSVSAALVRLPLENLEIFERMGVIFLS